MTKKRTAGVNVLYTYIFFLAKVSISMRASGYNGDIVFSRLKYNGIKYIKNIKYKFLREKYKINFQYIIT